MDQDERESTEWHTEDQFGGFGDYEDQEDREEEQCNAHALAIHQGSAKEREDSTNAIAGLLSSHALPALLRLIVRERASFSCAVAAKRWCIHFRDTHCLVDRLDVPLLSESSAELLMRLVFDESTPAIQRSILRDALLACGPGSLSEHSVRLICTRAEKMLGFYRQPDAVSLLRDMAHEVTHVVASIHERAIDRDRRIDISIIRLSHEKAKGVLETILESFRSGLHGRGACAMMAAWALVFGEMIPPIFAPTAAVISECMEAAATDEECRIDMLRAIARIAKATPTCAEAAFHANASSMSIFIPPDSDSEDAGDDDGGDCGDDGDSLGDDDDDDDDDGGSPDGGGAAAAAAAAGTTRREPARHAVDDICRSSRRAMRGEDGMQYVIDRHSEQTFHLPSFMIEPCLMAHSAPSAVREMEWAKSRVEIANNPRRYLEFALKSLMSADSECVMCAAAAAVASLAKTEFCHHIIQTKGTSYLSSIVDWMQERDRVAPREGGGEEDDEDDDVDYGASSGWQEPASQRQCVAAVRAALQDAGLVPYKSLLREEHTSRGGALAAVIESCVGGATRGELARVCVRAANELESARARGGLDIYNLLIVRAFCSISSLSTERMGAQSASLARRLACAGAMRDPVAIDAALRGWFGAACRACERDIDIMRSCVPPSALRDAARIVDMAAASDAAAQDAVWGFIAAACTAPDDVSTFVPYEEFAQLASTCAMRCNKASAHAAAQLEAVCTRLARANMHRYACVVASAWVRTNPDAGAKRRMYDTIRASVIHPHWTHEQKWPLFIALAVSVETIERDLRAFMTSMRHSDSLMSTALSYVQKTRMIGVVLSIYGDGISMRFKQECAESIIAIFSTLGQTLAMTKQPAGAIVDAVDLAAGEVLLAWVLSRNFELPAMIKRVAVFEISYAAKEIAIAMKPCAERDAAGAAREFVEPLERLIRTHPRPLHENIVSAEIKERTEFGISCVEDRMMVEALSDISSAFLRARIP